MEVDMPGDPDIPEDWYHPSPSVKPNLCAREIMFECTSGPALSQQQRCRFFFKSRFREECMHRHFERPVLCDSLKAQRDAEEKEKGS